MFTKIQKTRLWELVNHIDSGRVENGRPCNCYQKEVVVPSLEELFMQTVKRLKIGNFRVERVAPRKANCVIRVFRHEELKGQEETFWIYGVEAFMKTPFGIVSKYGYDVEYSEHNVKKWIFYDDSVVLKPHFVDYFVRIR